MTGARYRTVYVTAADGDEALRLARLAVEEGLAACANIIPAITSIYRWQGRLCEDSETAVLLKTTLERVDELVRRIGENHSYGCPAIVVWPIVGGAADYLQWIGNSVSPPSFDDDQGDRE